MQRALGGGPEVLALALSAVWVLGSYGVPLAHGLQHQSDELAAGHCHGTVCHDIGSDRADGAGTSDPAVSDGSLPDLGSFALSHGDSLATTPALVALVPPALTLVPAIAGLALADRRADRAPDAVTARGPPRS